MSDTPRTDAHAVKTFDSAADIHYESVDAGIARQLERELIAMTKQWHTLDAAANSLSMELSQAEAERDAVLEKAFERCAMLCDELATREFTTQRYDRTDRAMTACAIAIRALAPSKREVP